MTMTTSEKTRSRRVLGLTLAVFGVAGLGVASAAQLNVDGQNVVAGVGAATDCDVDGVSVALVPTYSPDAPAAGYRVTEALVGDLNDAGSTCSGTISLVVMDSSGNALAEGSIGYPSSPTAQVTISLSSPVTVSTVTGVAVAIG